MSMRKIRSMATLIAFMAITSLLWLAPMTNANAFGQKTGAENNGLNEAQKNEVWVKRSDRGMQCSPGSGQSLDEGAAELRKAGIEVLKAERGHDQKMRIQVCGASTGRENSYLIYRKNLPKAIFLGFKEAPNK